MSSALTHEQREILRNVAGITRNSPVAGLSDLHLLQRAGLIVQDGDQTMFRLTEAGKRYVAFMERTQPPTSHELLGLSASEQSNFFESQRLP